MNWYKQAKLDFDFNSFDRFRYIRNGINYYGSKVDYEQGKKLIRKLFNLFIILIK
jgi:hypothetical protein